MAKYLEFRLIPRPEHRKTDMYDVWNKEDKSFLGRVSWYASWRCFAFYPSGRNLVFERVCLRDIAEFLDQLMEKRKLERANDTRT